MRVLRIVATAGMLLTPCALAAQEPVDSDPPAHVSFVDGTAVIERDGKADTSPTNMPLLAGDRIRTESGRVEILYADGSTLHVDNFTTVDFQSDELVRVLDGRVRLTVAGRPRDVGYRIDGPGAWAHITQPGEYRFALTRGERGMEVELAVLRGAAELVNDDGRTPLRAGERAFARAGAAPSYAYVFNSASWDAFDRWSEERRDYRLGLSAQYLPEAVRPYTRAFDRYGSWRHEPAYGYVWYPTVAVGWRPYYYGRWATYRPWGWFWIGNDPWAWPTHHYGRWGFSAGTWFWIPGRTWGPAWVSWAYAPSHISWCPLGWNNRPVFSIVNINIYRGYDPWRGWTVIRRDHFGRDYVHRRVVNWQTLDARSRGNWEFGDSAPEFRGYAVPRAQAPIRVVGRAVPRGTGGSAAPVYTNLPRDASRVQSAGPRIQMTDRPAAGGVDRDVGARAVPRADTTNPPRMVPERGVRSAPILRSGGESESSARPRAVQRDPAARDAEAPAMRRNDASGATPSIRRAPAPRQPSSDVRSGDQPAQPDRGVRAIPRGSAGNSGWGAPARVPSERRAPAEPSGGGSVRPRDDGGWSAPQRAPVERANPDRPSYGEPRAMPRAVPRAPESRPAPSMPAPPRIERRDPPSRSADAPPQRSAPPSRTAPGGGGDRRGGAVRRRDG